ncbi:MAG: ATP-binding protein [Candidatus Riflebacteria bacterium]|nr:ATP-binding protein [Candidatus Riflebacteria bacterium]
MKSLVIPVKNIGRLSEASDALLTRTPGTPGMGLIFGKSGYGKTTATAWFVNQCNGVYVRALSTWTPGSMLQTILRELDVAPTKLRAAPMVTQIAEILRITGRPLFLDEFDYIVEDKKMTETLRDIHDLSSVPIILVGMDGVQQKVQLRDQFVNRIAQWVEFKAADFEDCRMLAELCEVKIKTDLLRRLFDAAKGVVRLIVIGLDAIERRAKTLGQHEISLDEWGNADFFLSDSPKAKKRGGY